MLSSACPETGKPARASSSRYACEMPRGFSGFATACCVCAACALASSAVLADALVNPWQALRTPAKGVARSIGDYSAGCLTGAETLPLDGDGYRVMRPGRRRNY